MRITGKVGTVIAGTALIAGVGATAFAGTTTTYSGKFAGSITYDNCSPAPGTHVASGTWSVTLKSNGDAVGTFDIYVDGQPHVSYTKQMKADTLGQHEVFAQTFKTQAGPIRVSLEGGKFSYQISPYDFYTPDWSQPMQCSAVTYWGNTGG